MLSLITALFSLYWTLFLVFISLQWLFAWQSGSSNLPLTCGCHEVAHSIVRLLQVSDYVCHDGFTASYAVFWDAFCFL